MTSLPHLPRGHPDFPLECEEALQPAYDALVLRHMQGGWREEDVALAIEGLAQAHLDSLVANDATDREIRMARRMAGMPELDEPDEPQPPRRDLRLGAIFALIAVGAVFGAWLALQMEQMSLLLGASFLP